jgi:hypothetical protein
MSPRRVEPAVLVAVAGGRLEHPCPPDPARIAVVVEALASALPADRLASAVWSYRPVPPQPVDGGVDG